GPSGAGPLRIAGRRGSVPGSRDPSARRLRRPPRRVPPGIRRPQVRRRTTTDHRGGKGMAGQSLRLVQFIDESGRRAVGVPDAAGAALVRLRDCEGVRDLALAAIERGVSLAAAVEARLTKQTESYDK